MRNSHGIWDALSPLELASSPKIAEMLKPFEKPITDCYECGVEVPTLPCKREATKDIGVAALFLKRALNDLRATWNLLLLGYQLDVGTEVIYNFVTYTDSQEEMGIPVRS
jgi:hypothetical protein